MVNIERENCASNVVIGNNPVSGSQVGLRVNLANDRHDVAQLQIGDFSTRAIDQNRRVVGRVLNAIDYDGAISFHAIDDSLDLRARRRSATLDAGGGGAMTEAFRDARPANAEVRKDSASAAGIRGAQVESCVPLPHKQRAYKADRAIRSACLIFDRSCFLLRQLPTGRINSAIRLA
jgi:hypothetical protein